MATSSQHRVVPRIWNDPEQVLNDWPANISPRRLKGFCDTMVHSFQYDGLYYTSAVFRCNTKVTTWGLEWIESTDTNVVICPKLKYMDRCHPTTGLNVIEMQGLDHSTGLLVVEELIPKSTESIRYGLILDYLKMDLEMCNSMTQKGMLSGLNNAHLWSPSEIRDEWDIIDEQRQEKTATTQTAAVSPAKPSAKKKAPKRKANITGAPGDDDEDDASRKKKKKAKIVPLTIQRAVNMTDIKVNKLSPAEMKAMNKLYTDTFLPLYKWGKTPLTFADDKLVRIHYKFLHEAPSSKLVYRGIQQDRLKRIKNKILVDADYHSENRYITVLPLKVGPHGPDKRVKFWDTCPLKENLTSTSHYYIIGGLHTVLAHKALVENGDIPEHDKAWASTFNVIPIWRKYDPRNLDICHLSRALNQDIVGEQREQSFTKQLVNCRVKWREVGSPMPAMLGRGHSKEYAAFVPVVSTIFTGVKGTDAADLKIPLLFLESDDDVARWIKIEENFLAYALPDGAPINSKAKRKPFAKNDFKPLYGMRTEDINYLAGLVEKGEVCMKSMKAGVTSLGQPLTSLTTAGVRERHIKIMKNELMNHYRQHLLPSKNAEYVPYTSAEWDSFAAEKRITREDLELWVDKSLDTELGKEWLKGRSKGLNKTSDPNDCPPIVKSMWQTFMGVHAQAAVEAVAVQNFEMEYCCREMDEATWDISSILADSDVKSWRGVGMTHIYFLFLFELSTAGARAKSLENSKLKRLFDALEYKDSNILRARSPAVLITDAEGFHSILCHLQKRFDQSRARVWDWHVVNYIPNGSDGFPLPITGANFNVFIVFLFAHDEDHGCTAAFRRFFPGMENLKAVYTSEEMEELEPCYRRRPKPWFKIATAVNIFGSLTFKDVVIVNVNGGAEFTFLGVWAGWKVLEIVQSEEARITAMTTARQIWDQFNYTRLQEEDEEEEEVDDAALDDDDVNAGEPTEIEEEEDEGDNVVDDADVDGFESGDEGTKETTENVGNSETETDEDLPHPLLKKPRSLADRRPQVESARSQAQISRELRVDSQVRADANEPASKATGSSVMSQGVRERRTKRNLDYPEMESQTHMYPMPLQSRDPDDDDVEILSPSAFVVSNRPSAHVPHPPISRISSPQADVEDPYCMSPRTDEAGIDNDLGVASGDLQLPETQAEVLSEDASGLRPDAEISQGGVHDRLASGDLQMDGEKPVVAGGDSTEPAGNADIENDHPAMGNDATRPGDEDSQREIGGEADLPRSHSGGGVHEEEAIVLSGDLQMSAKGDTSSHQAEDIAQEDRVVVPVVDVPVASDSMPTPAVDMSENIVQDTLLDLNPMSPEAAPSKVNPFVAQLFPGFNSAQVLENKAKYDIFLECPKFRYTKKGIKTKASKESRNVWRANQFLYDSLFEVAVDRHTQAHEQSLKLPAENEERKGSEQPKPTDSIKKEEMALLVVLTGRLCVEGGIADLPQHIDIPFGIQEFFKYLVENSLCGIWSCMHISTLSELLLRLLPVETINGFLYIAGANNPNKKQPYPNHAEFLKHLLKSSRQCSLLWNQTIRILEVDPLKWPRVCKLEPSIFFRDDEDSLTVQRPYYVVKEMMVAGPPKSYVGHV